jgi:hypothetical protein
MNKKLQIINFKRWLNSQGIYEDNCTLWDSIADRFDPLLNYHENFEKLWDKFVVDKNSPINEKWDKFVEKEIEEEIEFRKELPLAEMEYLIEQYEKQMDDKDINVDDLESLVEQERPERPTGITSYYTQEEKEMIEIEALLKNQSLSSFIKEIILNHLKK